MRQWIVGGGFAGMLADRFGRMRAWCPHPSTPEPSKVMRTAARISGSLSPGVECRTLELPPGMALGGIVRVSDQGNAEDHTYVGQEDAFLTNAQIVEGKNSLIILDDQLSTRNRSMPWCDWRRGGDYALWDHLPMMVREGKQNALIPELRGANLLYSMIMQST